LAIQLNKIENEDNRVEILDKNKYQFCICRINVILLHILGEKYEKLTKILEELQNKLENIMDNIDTNIKRTAKECIKLILLDYPYPDYNNEYNVDDIFNNDNTKIRNFIRTLKTKYHPDRFNINFNDNEIQEEHRNTARNICGHLNNIYDLIDN
jgi:predicted transcriptional regulator